MVVRAGLLAHYWAEPGDDQVLVDGSNSSVESSMFWPSPALSPAPPMTSTVPSSSNTTHAAEKYIRFSDMLPTGDQVPEEGS